MIFPRSATGRDVALTGTVRSGLLILAAAIVGWAYALAVLTPAMPVVARTAPMPGGDGEIFLWVAELRWTAILLAALGLLTVLAGRRGAALGPVLLTVLLLGVDGVLERSGAAGGGGLALALFSGALATAVAGWLGGRLGPGTESPVARRRLAVVAIVAAGCAPLPLAQGTPAVNHPFLPVGLSVLTAGLPVLLIALAAVAVVAARPRRIPLGAVLGVAAPPALALAGLGLATGRGLDQSVTSRATLLAVPLAVLVVALLRWHPVGRPVRTGVLWTTLTLVSAVASPVLVVGGAFLSMITSSILFEIAGRYYPADGVSVLPGAVLLALAVGLPLAGQLVDAAAPDHPDPATGAVPRPAPPPAVA